MSFWSDIKDKAGDFVKGYATGSLIDPTGLVGGYAGGALEVGGKNITDYLNPSNYFGNENQVEEAQDNLSEVKNAYQDNYDYTMGKTDEYKNAMEGLYGNAPEQYQQALEKYVNSPEFQYNKSVEDFASPAQQMRVKEAMNAITKSNANAGNMFSSDYLNQLNAKAQAMASEEYDKAYDRMMKDRQMGLQEYTTNQNKLGNIASMMGQDAGKYADALGNYYSTQIDASNALTNGIADLNTQGAQLNMQKKSWLQDLLNPFG